MRIPEIWTVREFVAVLESGIWGDRTGYELCKGVVMEEPLGEEPRPKVWSTEEEALLLSTGVFSPPGADGK